MPANDIYETTYNFSYATLNMSTVFHFVQIGSDGTGDARDSVNLMFEQELETPYLEGLVDAVVSQAVRSRRLFPTQTQALTRTILATGTITTDGMPPNLVGVLRTYGPLAGRKGIGRILVPGLPEEDIIKGRLNADQITFRNAFAAKLEVDQADGTTSYLWHAAVLSRIDNVARQIENAGMLTQIKNLRPRTRTG